MTDCPLQGELKICLSTLCVSDINDTSTLKLTIYLRCKDIKFEINEEFCLLILKQGTTTRKICVYFICLLQKIKKDYWYLDRWNSSCGKLGSNSIVVREGSFQKLRD